MTLSISSIRNEKIEERSYLGGGVVVSELNMLTEEERIVEEATDVGTADVPR